MRAYNLTPSTRELAKFFEATSIDEEKQILWSEQDLSLLGCQEVFESPQFTLQYAKKPLISKIALVCIYLPISIFIVLAAEIFKLVPNRRLKKMASLAKDWLWWVGVCGVWHSRF